MDKVSPLRETVKSELRFCSSHTAGLLPAVGSRGGSKARDPNAGRSPVRAVQAECWEAPSQGCPGTHPGMSRNLSTSRMEDMTGNIKTGIKLTAFLM